MKVKELKVELEKLGLSTKGKKAELEARLVEATAEDDIVEEVVEEEQAEEELEDIGRIVRRDCVRFVGRIVFESRF